MGDLSKLRVAIAQADIAQERPSACERALDHAIEGALDEGADLLVVAGSLVDEKQVNLYALNDTRMDVAGNVAVLDACDETYRVAIGEPRPDCDFSVRADVSPFLLRPAPDPVSEGDALTARLPRIALKPVGMRDAGKKVLAFDGGSRAFAADGTCVAGLSDDFAPGVCAFSFTDEPQKAPDACDKKVLTALVATLRRFDSQVLDSRMKWVIGLSGGLDSSIVAALLVLAFGPDRVLAYGMSTRFNSAVTRDNAAHVARSLGVTYQDGSIEHMVVALGNALVGYGYAPDALAGLTLENAQARARGQLLSTFAALEGGVVANNGNRVECALGYATLYGDTIGALAPIADLTKVQLFDLARDINDTFGYEVIPTNLLPRQTADGYEWETMPSAELSLAQRDPMKWFYHDWLVCQLLGDGRPGAVSVDEAACDIMQRYLDDRLAGTPAEKWLRFYGLDEPCAFLEDLEWVRTSMHASAFKRVQAPPSIAIASPQSASPRCEPQVVPEVPARYHLLSAKLRRL